MLPLIIDVCLLISSFGSPVRQSSCIASIPVDSGSKSGCRLILLSDDSWKNFLRRDRSRLYYSIFATKHKKTRIPLLPFFKEEPTLGDRIFQSAVEMYGRTWGSFKHKVPTHYSPCLFSLHCQIALNQKPYRQEVFQGNIPENQVDDNSFRATKFIANLVPHESFRPQQCKRMCDSYANGTTMAIPSKSHQLPP